MVSTADIRSKFLGYFEEQGHQIVRSSSLVPGNDATLLFTNAGMVQFKDCFLGQEKRDNPRATTSQRCVRAGGKHNDLENVGYTARHHTFFEMLGNFSFGDYFKEEAIRFAWTFLTERLGLDKDKLWVTVFEEDDEAYDLWAQKMGVPVERIARIGAKDNFWQMGDTGPCGPCTEIFYDHGPDVWGGPPGTPEEDGDRYIEIWNLVFMQYDRSADGTLTPLPKPSVDTGMGLERIAAVMQGVHSNYEIDLFQRLIAASAKETGCSDLNENSLKVIADHIRSCAFMIVDGVVPSNEGRGYVLRRIIRRAARHGHKLGQSKPFFYRLVDELVDLMGEAYPELVAAQSKVSESLKLEEERFLETLNSGMKILEDEISRLNSKCIPGDLIFRLYDTYGFPADLTADIARERGLDVDMPGFEVAMEAQRGRGRAAKAFASSATARIQVEQATTFLGYTESTSVSNVQSMFNLDGDTVTELNVGDQAIITLDQTPFYAESGGQVGDSGRLYNDTLHFDVHDTQKIGDGFLHFGVLRQGKISLGDQISAEIDRSKRQATILNHSATHLMHAALREVLGEHVEQKGSLVNQDYLRFDFSHNQSVTAEELSQVEYWVNQRIRENEQTIITEMDIDSAKAKGAMALFGEKYGDVVRVVELGQYSVELCGGTHVDRIGDIGLFKITVETAIASGVRRIEAVTGEGGITFVTLQEQHLKKIASRLKSGVEQVDEKVAQLIEKQRQMQKELDRMQAKLAATTGAEMLQDAVQLADGTKVLVKKVDSAGAKGLRDLADQLKSKIDKGAIVLSTVEDGKVRLIACVTKSLHGKLKAGDLVNFVAAQVGGKGGGRPDMAQAGGDSPELLDAALEGVVDWVRTKLELPA